MNEYHCCTLCYRTVVLLETMHMLCFCCCFIYQDTALFMLSHVDIDVINSNRILETTQTPSTTIRLVVQGKKQLVCQSRLHQPQPLYT